MPIARCIHAYFGSVDMPQKWLSNSAEAISTFFDRKLIKNKTRHRIKDVLFFLLIV